MRKRILFSLLLSLGLGQVLGAQQPMPLSLKQAVDAALDAGGNVQVQLAREAVRQAEAHAGQVRADLLPDISASVGQQSQTISLTEFGLQSAKLSNGLQLPNVVGPFNTFDARGKLTQKLVDLSSIRRYQSARVSTEAVKEDSETANENAAAEAARAYLAAVRAQALVETAHSNVELSDALLNLAKSQKDAGTGTGIEITRAQVQLANDRQRLLAAEADFTKARLQLLKTLGIGLNVELVLTDPLSYTASAPISLKDAVASAHESLAELRAQRKREQSASLNYKATALERMPSIVGFADYGTIGLSATQTTPTRAYGATIQIPIFDGGRRDARRAESMSLLRQERIKSADLNDAVELNIRIALDAVESADAQVRAAEIGFTLASDELEQAQRRYKAGVGTSIEVTDAQTRLQRSRENRISAIFNHSLARIDLAAATGSIHELVRDWRADANASATGAAIKEMQR